MAIYFTRMRKTHRISPNLVQIKYDLLFHITGPILQDTVYVAPVKLRIPGHEPSAYFDVAEFETDTYHIVIIAYIAINMTAPTREQFMAGVNSTGPDGRLLPAGAAAAARMTAAALEALTKGDDESFSTASVLSREVEREKDKLIKKNENGEKKSLLRRVGSKIASAFKREQEKMN